MLLRFAASSSAICAAAWAMPILLSLTMFSGISGSALADAARPSSMMVKMMDKASYSRPLCGCADGQHRHRRPHHSAIGQHDHLCAAG